MNILYTKTAHKAFLALEPKTQERIKAGVNKIPVGDIKELKGHDGLFRLRIGKYRVIYKYNNNDIIVIDLGSRGDIYK